MHQKNTNSKKVNWRSLFKKKQ